VNCKLSDLWMLKLNRWHINPEMVYISGLVNVKSFFPPVKWDKVEEIAYFLGTSCNDFMGSG